MKFLCDSAAQCNTHGYKTGSDEVSMTDEVMSSRLGSYANTYVEITQGSVLTLCNKREIDIMR